MKEEAVCDDGNFANCEGQILPEVIETFKNYISGKNIFPIKVLIPWCRAPVFDTITKVSESRSMH